MRAKYSELIHSELTKERDMYKEVLTESLKSLNELALLYTTTNKIEDVLAFWDGNTRV